LPAAFSVLPVPQSRPWFRFTPPLIEPDVRLYRIRLSEQLAERPHLVDPAHLDAAPRLEVDSQGIARMRVLVVPVAHGAVRYKVEPGDATGVGRSHAAPRRRSVQRLRAIRDDPKTPFPFDPVGLEIIVIYGEDRGERLPPREVDQSGICEIHRPVLIAVHQGLDIGKVVVRNRQNGHCARIQESPSPRHVPRAREEVKDLGENRGRRSQWKSESGKGLQADLVPPVAPIQKRQDRSGIDEALRSKVHAGVQSVPALRTGRSLPDPDYLRSCQHISGLLHAHVAADRPRHRTHLECAEASFLRSLQGDPKRSSAQPGQPRATDF